MEWQSQLITIYLMVCTFWEQGLWTSCQRMSNHNHFALTDPEIITIYLFGVTKHRTEIKSIYNFTRDHKDSYYYGVKLHVVANDRDGALPIPEYIGISSASCHDLTAFRDISQVISNSQIFGDKAYRDQTLESDLLALQNVELLLPVKRSRGQEHLDLFDKLYSSTVSGIRQPIESLFNWLQEKTAIQTESKVRSYRGLVVHLFGKLAAGLMMLLGLSSEVQV